MAGVTCPNDPTHPLRPIPEAGVRPEPQLIGTTSTGEEIAATFTCPTCSETRSGPVHFGEQPGRGPVELVVPGQTVTGATKATRRRLPRTIAVGLVGLAVIAYLATAYSWFDDSIWGGVAFFVLFAALAIAYRADDDAARRRRVPQRPVT